MSKPYTWYEGNDQYLGLMLCAGINAGRIEQIYNGDTLLSSFEGVQVYHAGYSQMPDQAIPLYSNADTIDGAELPKDQAWLQRTTSANTMRIQINLEYVLGGTGTSGKSYSIGEMIAVEYRPVGTANWRPLASKKYHSDRFDVRRATLGGDVALGQYDVRVRSLGEGNYSGKNTQKNDFQWTTLTSVRADGADYTGIARTGIRIKATGQLNGSPDELRGIAAADPIPEWDGSNWTMKESSNPGAQCVAYARGIRRGGRLLGGMALSDSQIDLASWQAFTLHCAANGYTYDHYIKEARSHAVVLSAIARAGFGEISWAGGRLGVVWAAQEQPLSGVVNMATIKKGQFQVDYSLVSAADGIECTYLDPSDWQPRTLRVPAPGVETMLNPAQVSGETGYHAAPFEMVIPESGDWTFACRSVNTSGELSTDARVVMKTLGQNLGQVIDKTIQQLIDAQLKIEQEKVDRFNEDTRISQQAAADATAKANAARSSTWPSGMLCVARTYRPWWRWSR